MLSAQAISSSEFTVKVVEAQPALSASLENEIEHLWIAEQNRRGKAIFNGSIMSATNVSCSGIEGCIVEYRYLIAQKANPDLFDTLRVRPVAVSGLLECADGLVFGRRANAMTQDAGLWELVPSGGIDANHLTLPARVDFSSQLLQELHEELGLST